MPSKTEIKLEFTSACGSTHKLEQSVSIEPWDEPTMLAEQIALFLCQIGYAAPHGQKILLDVLTPEELVFIEEKLEDYRDGLCDS